MTVEVRRASIQYPGGLRALWRWGGSGSGPEVFALSEVGGTLEELALPGDPDPTNLCRAELRVEGPAGTWTVRLASTIYAEPAGLLWDTPGLLVVTYGFHTWGLEARTGVVRWSHRSATPILAAFGAPRLANVIVQSELETFAIDPTGEVAWRIAHSDVVAEASLIGGKLVLTSYGGALSALDPATGRTAG